MGLNNNTNIYGQILNKMKIIKLTSLNDNTSIYVNIQHIGHFYRNADKMNYGRVEKPAHTRLGITTHNNGGFEVKETPEQIIKLMKL